MSGRSGVSARAEDAQAFAIALLQACGVSREVAAEAGEALVEADLDGTTSHGLIQLPNYLRRLRAGTIAKWDRLDPIVDRGAIAVFDARLMVGQAGAAQAMSAAAAKARAFGLGAAAVRNGTHFGTCGRYARQAAHSGLVGLAMCNTRPMMPAPGGVEAVVGNNPIAIAIPGEEGRPIVLDMAMSATAMGKIRQAAAQGRKIAPGLALNKDGSPTDDPLAAISGMLLPAGGAKGFGLALMVDLLSGLLSGGSIGSGVGMMFGDPARPADCSWLMIAIDPAFFGDAAQMRRQASEVAAGISAGKAAPGAAPPQAPGFGRQDRLAASQGRITISQALATELDALAAELSCPPLIRLQAD